MNHAERGSREFQLRTSEFVEKITSIKEKLKQLGCSVTRGGHRIGTTERFETAIYLTVPDAHIEEVKEILVVAGINEYVQRAKDIGLPLAHTVIHVGAVFPERMDEFIRKLRNTTTFEFYVGENWTEEYSEKIKAD